MLGFLTTLSPRQLAQQILNILMVVASALAAWKAAGVVLNVDSPIVVVLSESMTPAFVRGDLLFLALTSAPLKVGDITVYKIKGHAIPIVHRILEIHEETETGKIKLLTKGDYNSVDDRGLYNRGQVWIEPEDVIGRVYAHVPYLGMITIILNDYPQTKIALLLFLGLAALFNKEEQA
ncbi:Signal peptidase complex catalytic subunit S11A [Boothiomyces sp. JEL0866]|nr:Signal peptidase complex catalytic subunit S11A [Boothiomyces sp. JEL0866]